MRERLPDLLQFGPFRLHVPTGELHKGRTRVRLQQHPLTLLLVLLERPGEVVTREEIRSRVWPNGTIVEFDHNINTAVNKLRAALSDRAEKPRYIETVPRRGYRFLAGVEFAAATPQPPAVETDPSGSLAPGSTISHYRIEEPIGSGAMGRVFAAVDLNLGRNVALKFLHEGSDSAALDRFRQEAQSIAALDHPGICSVYEFGEHAGRPFLTMQLLEGQDLAHRLRTRGPLAPDALLPLALQLASALEAAHSRGVIHRDIKPANIFLTRSGQAKILDFGLAKFGAQPQPPEAPVTLPASPQLSTAGAVMGTAAYMSPEQMRGEPVDHLTDLFSFGLVLYEMAVGRHPFADFPDGQIPGLIRTAPVPRPSKRNPRISRELEALILRLLEKDRELRPDSFAAVRATLAKMQRPHGLTRQRKAVLAGIIVLAAIIASTLALRRAPAHAGFTVQPFTSSPGLKEHLSVSPDGSQLAYAWYADDDNEDIYVHNLAAQTPVRLTSDPARDFSPAWSPDGRQIAFLRSQSGRYAVYMVGATGGSERRLLEFRANPAPFCRGLAWSPDGEHLAITEWRSRSEGGPELSLISAANGSRVRRLLSHSGEFLCAPAFSPDGGTIAVLKGADFRASDISIVPVAGGAERRLTFDDRMIQGLAWSPSGASLIYSFRRIGPFGLWEVPLTGGSPQPLLETGNDLVDPHVLANGSRIATVRDMWDTNIWRVEGPAWSGGRSGPSRVIASTREDAMLDVSPDGSHLAFMSARSGAFEIWRSRASGSEMRRLTEFKGPMTGYPRWSRDGKTVAFVAYPDGQPAIYLISAEGGAPRRRGEGEMPFWSADGRWIYFLRSAGGSRSLWKVPVEDGDPVKVLDTSANLLVPAADGRIVLYEENGCLWKRVVDGGAPECIARDIEPEMWSAAPEGACYLRRDRASFHAECVTLATGAVKRVASLGSWPRVYGPPGFAVSPDGKWIYYQRVDQLESNIMLVER